MALTWEEKDTFLRPNARFLALASSNAYRIAAEVDEWATGTALRVEHFDQDDTQAFAAVHPDYVILSFRGTETKRFGDIQTDIKVRPVNSPAGGTVHRGFAAALDTVWDRVEAVLAQHPEKRLWITGHSLGGALAVLAASRLPDRVFGLYTFGQPRVGDEEFARACQQRFGRRYFRFVHGRDVVPRIPAFTTGYRHFGWEVTAGHPGMAFQQGQVCGVEGHLDALSLASGIGGITARKIVAFAPQLLNWVDSAARGDLDLSTVRMLLDGFALFPAKGVREFVDGLKSNLADPKSLALGTVTDHSMDLYRKACDLE
jgi:triacylglycerol lipase